MSKKCIWCGCEVNPNVIQGMYYCPHCDEDLTDKDVLPMTVFDKITESAETLAEKLVTTTSITTYGGKFRHQLAWCSLIVEGFWYTRDEALIATIEELKKEFNNGC